MPVVVNRHHFADPRSRKPDRRPPLPEPLVFAPKPALLCRLCGRARRCTGCGGRGELLTEPVHPEEAGRLT